MRRRNDYLRLVQISVLALIVLVSYGIKQLRPVHTPSARPAATQYYVQRVVDGDTIVLSDGKKVRLLGIDTPELHESDKLTRDARRSGNDTRVIRALGTQAAQFARALLEHKEVRLEFDTQKRDRYGRLLAYVWLEDGTMANARIIEAGYAQVMTIPPNVKYADHFLRLQRNARQEKRGLWSSAPFVALSD